MIYNPNNELSDEQMKELSEGRYYKIRNGYSIKKK